MLSAAGEIVAFRRMFIFYLFDSRSVMYFVFVLSHPTYSHFNFDQFTALLTMAVQYVCVHGIL